MTAMREWVVREATPADRAFLEEVAPRLTIGMAPWRDRGAMLAAMRRFLLEDLDKMGADATVMVALADDGAPAGVATVAIANNFTGERQAYLGELVVREEAEGRGAASVLLDAVERWARERDLPFVVLDTGTLNTRARDFYTRHGYGEESVRLVKPLSLDTIR